VGDILIGPPNLPQFGSAGSLGLGILSNQCDRLADARSPTALLMSAMRKVIVQMNDVGDAGPMLLNYLKSFCELAYC
jgi:hypothetical protein